jgi:hypothetical protein
MQVLREISTQTADATSNTSDAIGKLAQLSAALRRSVAGFRLPDAPGTSASQRMPALPESLAPASASPGTPPPPPPPRRVAGKTNG